MKKGLIYTGLSIITSIFIGCGNGDLDTKDLKYTQTNIFDKVVLKDIDYKNYNVKAVDDPIINATIEARECNSSKEIGNGDYILEGCISQPKFIAITGGVMVTKDGNITQSFPLLLNTKQISDGNDFVVSPLTTIVATIDDNDTLIEEIATKLGLSKDELFQDPRDIDNNDVNGSELALKINNLFIQASENGNIVNKTEFIKTVQDKIKKADNSGKDLNFSKVAEEVNKVAQDTPDFFGFVMIPTDKVNSKDILSELNDLQHPSELHFSGFVFDKSFEANITIYEQNGSKITDANVTTDENGYWVIKDNSNNLKDIIDDTNQTLIFEAVKEDNSSIVLKSVISTPKLRELIAKQKRITATKETSLIISNVTTAEYAMLDKRKVFSDGDIQAYENNKSNIKTYYNDEILKASAVIKAVVDKGADLGDSNDTLDLITDAFDDKGDFNVSKTEVNETIVSDMETQIQKSPILKTQLNNIDTPTVLDDNGNDVKRVTLEDEAKVSNYTFYRLFAYKLPDDEGNIGKGILIREYEKFIIAPAGFEYKKYRLKDGDTEWSEVKDEYKTSEDSNFNNGDFSVTEKDVIQEFSLDDNNSIYVDDLNKTYNYYNIIESDYELDGITIDKRTPVIWVDNFDVVDGFRRLEDSDKKDLEDEVDGLSKDEVNSKLNKYIRDYIDSVGSYFKD